MPITDKPFGSWVSPITSKAITAGSVRLSGLQCVSSSLDDKVFWTEMRPQDAGRYVLCQYDTTSSNNDDDDDIIRDMSPPGSNVRTRVHEYGGAAVTFANNIDNDDLTAFYSEFTTQRLHKLVLNDGDKDSTTTPSEPMTPDKDGHYRFADGCHDASRNMIWCIREDHTHNPGSPKDVVNEIVGVSTTTTNDDDTDSTRMTVVATGQDFFAAPRLSPDGTQLAYVTWNHPNMPWDATQLKVVTLLPKSDKDPSYCDNPQTESHTVIAGGTDPTTGQDISVLQPLWHPQTGELFYISDESGYYNIYKTTTTNDAKPTHVTDVPFDFGGAAPGWSLGQQGFSFLPDGRLVASYTKDGKSVLLVANVSGPGPARELVEYDDQHGLPRQFGNVVTGSGDNLYFLGGSPSTPTSVYQWNINTQGPAKVIKCSSTLSYPDGIISSPQSITFPTAQGREAYGYYYPPQNEAFTCTSQTAPPLLVKAHGGPTACTGTTFNANIQYWTSRGFAVLDVDYGGSTGYGRDYRRRLRKSWGIVDIEDVCAGAEYLVSQNKADPKRLCIDGGSAGGFTTLGALAFKDVFKAGCSLYGVGDLSALAGDTHKFESRYLDGLVGAYPAEKEVYQQRSPIESVDTLSCPILLLQGDEDKIVPPNQAEMMHRALLKKGIPTCLKMYRGEQHGFRKAENIEDALDSELAFYGKVFGFEVPGGIDLKIDNM